MIARILSIAGPLWVYASLAILIYGLWGERRKLDWLALLPAIAGLLASIVFLSPIHRLFFDEDIYISIAGNLTHAPVNQLTVVGGPGEVQVSSYYKEPPGWPVLLSLVFLITGRSETVAFWAARILFAMAIAAVHQLAIEILGTRRQALAAAMIFGATPICFWFSVSAGTDIPAALFATLGMWGLLAGNGPLVAAGFALAAQTRMELLLLVPLVWVSRKISFKWKMAAASLVVIETVHVAWVMSVAPVLAQAERVTATFSPKYIGTNLLSNLSYMLNPYTFSLGMMVVALLLAFYRGWRPWLAHSWLISFQTFGLFVVYLCFYSGSFDTNPRYSIQMLAPIAVLTSSLLKGRAAFLLLSLVLPYTRSYEITSYLHALEADHRLSVEFASEVKANDLIVSAEPEMFLNQGRAH